MDVLGGLEGAVNTVVQLVTAKIMPYLNYKKIGK
jgi:hypothetical protein